MPAMNTDLTVRNVNVVLQWTIHRITHGNHTVKHVTYADRMSDGLINLPNKLSTIRHQSDIKVLSSKGYNLRLPSNDFKKQDEYKLLKIHSELAQKSLRSDNFPDLQQQIINLKQNYIKGQQQAFVYEYGEYTIIANTLLYKKTDLDRNNFTSYTIIHWGAPEHAAHKPNSGSGTSMQISSSLQSLNYKMNNLSVATRHMQDQMKNFETLRYNPVLIDNTNLDYFIPAILENMQYAKSQSVNRKAVLSDIALKTPL